MSDDDATPATASDSDDQQSIDCDSSTKQPTTSGNQGLSIALLRLKKLVLALASGLLGGLLVIIILGTIHLNGRTDLNSWHEIQLAEEFTRRSDVASFRDYLELEDRLFKELDEKIYAASSQGSPEAVVNRYQEGSPADPRGHGVNGNRTFELIPDTRPASASVLLLHGMSDSPYSLRRVGESLQARGAHVIGLRLPGHGTAPVALTTVDWRDMKAATELAAAHLRESNPDAPLYLIGYSNGGGLAIHHAISSLRDEDLATPEGIVLISPAIGVSPMARIAVWQGRLGRLTGLEKLAWNSIRPEYDPYKYNSFAVNAGHQVHLLTRQIDRDLARMADKGELKEFPPVVAFQSVVDATVSAPALIENLFARLPQTESTQQHELVLFDINRDALVDHLIEGDPTERVADILLQRDPQFRDYHLQQPKCPQRSTSRHHLAEWHCHRTAGHSRHRLAHRTLLAVAHLASLCPGRRTLRQSPPFPRHGWHPLSHRQCGSSRRAWRSADTGERSASPALESLLSLAGEAHRRFCCSASALAKA